MNIKPIVRLFVTLLFGACLNPAVAQQWFPASLLHDGLESVRERDPNYWQMSEPEKQMYAHINIYRADRGLPALKVDPVLLRVARLRVSVFNHHHPKYGWSWEHAHREGFSGSVIDNLAQGYESPEAAVGNGRTGWGDERRGHTVGHDMAMKGFSKVNGRFVDQKFNCCGVATNGRNYIAVFGRR